MTFSTEHNAQNSITEPILKPEVMNKYIKYMGGVDLNDQLAKYSAFNRRSCKWWKKWFSAC